MTPVPMIGRDRELEVLTGTWNRVAEEGRAHLATVFGPAGIGKSRLALELAAARRRSRRSGHPRPLDTRTERAARTARSASRSNRSPRSSTATTPRRLARSSQPRSPSSPGPPPRRSTRRTSPCCSGSRARTMSRTARRCSSRPGSSSSRVALSGPTLAPVRRHPLGGREHARPARDPRGQGARGAGPLRHARAAELLTDRPGWGGGLPGLHGTPARSAHGRIEHGARRAAARRGRLRGRRGEGDRRAPRTATRCSSRSSPPRSPSARRRVPSPRASGPSSPPGSTRLPPDERSVLVDASVVGRVFWQGALAEIAQRDDVTGTPRIARGAGSDPPGSRLTHTRGPAVRVQARIDPRRRVPDPFLAPRAASGMPRSLASSSRRRTQGSHTKRSATTGARRARRSARSIT